MSKYKPFDTDLYNKNNDPACNAVMHYLSEDLGLYAVRNDDLYGPDIIVFNGLKKSLYVEVEVKLVWQTSQSLFPWRDINLPVRKEKFLKLGLPIEFWILREDLQMAVVIPDFVVERSIKVEVPNKYNKQGEFFYKINVDECILKDLT